MKFVRAILVALAVFGLELLLVAAAPSAPNVVMILADDLGYGDLGCYGSQRHETPHVDRLAREGLRFTDFYVTSPICTPTRVALLTGRYPLRAGLADLIWPTDTIGLPAAEVTIAEVLKTSGYATGCIGKWHLGHAKPEHLPMAQGFDYWFGMPYPNDMDARHPVAISRKEVWPPLPLYRNDQVIEQPVDVDQLTQKLTSEAVRFIRTHRRRPFFLYLSHAMPHTYLGASRKFRGKSRNGLYGDAVQELDWSTGRVISELRRLGLERRTLVFFTSDNGAALRKTNAPPAEERLFHPDGTYGSNAPLRGGKQMTFEGGVRVPAIAWWPGVIPSGGVVLDPAICLDLFPTILDLCHTEAPAGRVLDGKSLVPSLLGNGRRESTPLYFGSGMITACRSGPWKLNTVRLPGQTWNARPAGVMLFNLQSDPGEQNDLAKEYPDLASRLRGQMAEFEASLKP